MEFHFSIHTTKFLKNYNLLCFQISGRLTIHFTKHASEVSTNFITKNKRYRWLKQENAFEFGRKFQDFYLWSDQPVYLVSNSDAQTQRKPCWDFNRIFLSLIQYKRISLGFFVFSILKFKFIHEKLAVNVCTYMTKIAVWYVHLSYFFYKQCFLWIQSKRL